MLQVDIKPFASDALEDAMRLAQVKSLNSFTFSDCLNYLNYAWRDIYDRVAMIDDGYYGRTMPLTQELTHLPDFVKNTVMVYHAQEPVGFNRVVFRDAGTADMTAHYTYRISGRDIYCKDATNIKVWLYYVPACPQLFFTKDNRDPVQVGYYVSGDEVHVIDTKLNTDDPVAWELCGRYGTYDLYIDNVLFNHNGDYNHIAQYDNVTSSLINASLIVLKHRSGNVAYDKDITADIIKDSDEEQGTWQLCYISCCYPYIFCSYKNSLTDEYKSGFYTKDMDWVEYNAFAFTGRGTNVKFMKSSWNDKTGMGVTAIDYNDLFTNSDGSFPIVKQLGWTPDTCLNYPAPEMYRYLVARLADKLAALNESNVMGVQKELVEAKFAFDAFLEKDKSAWKRIENVNTPTIGDWL